MLQKVRSYRILSLLLALIVISSSLEYDITLHYCKGNFAGISLFEISTSCSKSKSTCAKKYHNEDSTSEEKDCSTNEAFHVESLDEEYLSYSSFLIELDSDITTKVISAHVTLINDEPLVWLDKYDLYRPPPPDIDVQSFYQVYLI